MSTMVLIGCNENAGSKEESNIGLDQLFEADCIIVY